MGGKVGERLTRCAFAAMLKFSGLLDDFENVVNEISLGLYGDDIGAIRRATPGVMKKIETRWATASEMRAWLTSEKNKIGEKEEGKEDMEACELKLLAKVRERVDYLLRFEKPEIWDLEEEKEGEDPDHDTPILVRAESSTGTRSRTESNEGELVSPALVGQHSSSNSSTLRKNSYSGVVMYHHEEGEGESL